MRFFHCIYKIGKYFFNVLSALPILYDSLMLSNIFQPCSFFDVNRYVKSKISLETNTQPMTANTSNKEVQEKSPTEDTTHQLLAGSGLHTPPDGGNKISQEQASQHKNGDTKVDTQNDLTHLRQQMERMMDILNNGLEKLITKQINQALGKEDNTAGSDGRNKKYPTRQANAEKKRERSRQTHTTRQYNKRPATEETRGRQSQGRGQS